MTGHVIPRVRQFWALGLMTVARVRRHRALDLIERELGKGDPHLRAMFAIFTGLTRNERPTGPERLPRGPGVWRQPVALTLVVPLLMVGLVVGLVGALAPGQASACPARPNLGSSASAPASANCR